MENVIPIGFAIVVVVGILAGVARAMFRSKRRARLFAEVRQFMGSVTNRKALSPVATNTILKPGENAFYSGASALSETRSVRQYQSGSTGFRVAKGVYVGRTKGRSVSTQELGKIDNGILTITNKRLIFDGRGEDRTVPLSKIVSADSSLTRVEVSVEGRRKSMILDAVNPLILTATIRNCCQADNPLDLSRTTLNVMFEV